ACQRGAMGTISVQGNAMIVPTLQRGNAAQDAPRPLSNVAQSSRMHPHAERYFGKNRPFRM
ncbi:hypothetical protein PVFL_11085, partial [Pseudomonas viridiflava]